MTTNRELTTRQAAEVIGVSPDVVRRLIREGLLDGRAKYPGKERPTLITTEQACRDYLAGITPQPRAAERRIIRDLSPEGRAAW